MTSSTESCDHGEMLTALEMAATMVHRAEAPDQVGGPFYTSLASAFALVSIAESLKEIAEQLKTMRWETEKRRRVR